MNINRAIFTVTMVVISVSLPVYSAEFNNLEAAKVSSSDIWVQSNKGLQSSVEFISDGNVAGVQFDVQSPSLTHDNYQCGTEELRATHQVLCKYHAESKFVRVIVFSLPASIIPDSTILTFDSSVSRNSKLAKKTNAAAKVTNVTFSDAVGENITPAHVSR